MKTVYRIVCTALFTASADRDAALAALKASVQSYNTANPGKITRADITPDEYLTADGSTTGQQIV